MNRIKDIQNSEIISIKSINAEKKRLLTVVMWVFGTFSFIWNTLYGTIAKNKGLLSSNLNGIFIVCLCVLFIGYLVKSIIRTSPLNLNRFGTLLKFITASDIIISFFLGLMPLFNKVSVALAGESATVFTALNILIEKLGGFVLVSFCYSVINAIRAYVILCNILVNGLAKPATFKHYRYDAANKQYIVETHRRPLSGREIKTNKSVAFAKIFILSLSSLLLLVAVAWLFTAF